MNGTSTINGQAEKPVHVSKEPARRAKGSVTRCYTKDSYSPSSCVYDYHTACQSQTEQQGQTLCIYDFTQRVNRAKLAA